MNSSSDQILELAERIRSYQAKGIDRSLSEQDTKALLVEPLLKMAGWDVADPTQVSREDRPTERPVDYALKLEGKPKILVECKRLSNRLESRRDLEQALAYAAAAGVKWCVLTNGSLVRIYNSLAPEVATKKLLEKLDLSKAGTGEGFSVERVLQVLRLISPESVRSGEIDGVWDQRYTGAKVREVVESLLTAPDPDLANLVRRRMKEAGQSLSKKEAVNWLKTLEIKVRPKPPKPPRGPKGRPPIVPRTPPRQMRIGGETFELTYSYEILTNTAEWLVSNAKLRSADCPIPIGRRRHLVHIEPKHRHGDDFRSPKRLSNALWIETHYSTAACIRNARRLLERFGYAGDTLEVG